MSKPIAVCISDIHFNLNTLPLASSALRSALKKAEDLRVPLIIAGDLNDTKAIIRAEAANEIISILCEAQIPVYILVGNHDLINEKGLHNGLNYLKPYARIVNIPTYTSPTKNLLLIPYYSDSTQLVSFLKYAEPNAILIMHQGFLGAAMGDYIQDKSSIDPVIVKDFKVISGHYHRHQTIGTVTYIGSPYTITFGEANDGPKGFLVLNEDGSFTREILHLRRHIIKEFNSIDELASHICPFGELFCNKDDLLILKIKGPYSELHKLNKNDLISFLPEGVNFKLDLIPTDSTPINMPSKENMTNEEIFDTIIDATGETEDQKKYLKGLYREVIKS